LVFKLRATRRSMSDIDGGKQYAAAPGRLFDQILQRKSEKKINDNRIENNVELGKSVK